jgi:hypothetical protein
MNLKQLQLSMLLCFALTLCVPAAHAQKNTKLKLDTRSAISTAQHVREMPTHGAAFAYSQTGFLNSTFYQNHADKLIEGGNALEFTFFQRVWLLRLDVGGFYGHFSTKSPAYHSIYHMETATYAGINGFVNFLPMPDWGKISKILVPSIGIGYQTASLQAIKEEGDTSETTGSLGVGGVMLKGCLHIYLGKRFFLHAEYRQGLDVPSNKAPHTLSFGLGGNF